MLLSATPVSSAPSAPSGGRWSALSLLSACVPSGISPSTPTDTNEGVRAISSDACSPVLPRRCGCGCGCGVAAHAAEATMLASCSRTTTSSGCGAVCRETTTMGPGRTQRDSRPHRSAARCTQPAAASMAEPGAALTLIRAGFPAPLSSRRTRNVLMIELGSSGAPGERCTRSISVRCFLRCFFVSCAAGVAGCARRSWGPGPRAAAKSACAGQLRAPSPGAACLEPTGCCSVALASPSG